MPLTIKRTNSTSIAANSVLFNGSSQYLTVGSIGNFNFLHNGLSDWTIEGWVNFNSLSGTASRNWISDGANTSTELGISIVFGGGISNGLRIFISRGASGGPASIVGYSTAADVFTNTNTWYHVAVTFNSSSKLLSSYINGTATAFGLISTYQNSVGFAYSNSNSAYVMAIGRGQYSAPFGYFDGYISNTRITNSVLYTASFTPLTSPLTAISGTQLLTCNAATIVDASTNNFTITNNGAATVSSINPFRAPINNFQFAKRTSDAVGNSVQFNGSTQYLSVPGSAAFAFGTGSFTTEWWQYMTSQPSNPRVFSIGNYPSTSVGVSIEGGTFYVWETGTFRFSYSLTSDGYLNRWLHFAVSRNNGTTRVFKNGIQIGAAYPDTNNINNTSTTLSIGQESTPTANSYFPGYISNFRILKGTALYTASFTPPTTPLTAIANTALLTCNADTIVDGSSNNFTITNTGTATVSSITPFVASSGGMSLKKVYADPVILFGIQKAIFGYGTTGTVTAITNLVSNTGVVATDTTGVGTERSQLAAASYGTDKAIFGYGYTGTATAITNLVSNIGVVASDTTGVGTARRYLAAAGYGIKAIFGYGYTTINVSMTNLVSNSGVVANDITGTGTARNSLAAVGYGTDKAIFGYGDASGGSKSMTNLVSNTGVVATDTTGVGTARSGLAAAGYGTDKAIFGYGYSTALVSITNLVSNTGVVANDTAGVGTVRNNLSAAGYGGDKSIFGYGSGASVVSLTNLVSNTGVVATDTTGVGTARQALAAAGFSLT